MIKGNLIVSNGRVWLGDLSGNLLPTSSGSDLLPTVSKLGDLLNTASKSQRLTPSTLPKPHLRPRSSIKMSPRRSSRNTEAHIKSKVSYSHPYLRRGLRNRTRSEKLTEPAIYPVGTTVSAKISGGYYEARVEGKHPDSDNYTVKIQNGTTTMLERKLLSLKLPEHFSASESLNTFPLISPERFALPVKPRPFPGTPITPIPTVCRNETLSTPSSTSKDLREKPTVDGFHSSNDIYSEPQNRVELLYNNVRPKSGTKCYICKAILDETTFVIECDECKEWFHASCTDDVSLDANNKPMCITGNKRDWVCLECHQFYHQVRCNKCKIWLYYRDVGILPAEADKTPKYVCDKCDADTDVNRANCIVLKVKEFNMIANCLDDIESFNRLSFNEPVGAIGYPELYRYVHITEPLEFEKIEPNQYGTLTDFIGDIVRIFEDFRYVINFCDPKCDDSRKSRFNNDSNRLRVFVCEKLEELRKNILANHTQKKLQTKKITLKLNGEHCKFNKC